MNNDWMNDPSLAGIDRAKLDFLQALVFESRGLKREQMLPFLMAVAKRGQADHITFTNEEIETIVAVIKRESSPEEAATIDKMMRMRKKKEARINHNPPIAASSIPLPESPCKCHIPQTRRHNHFPARSPSPIRARPQKQKSAPRGLLSSVHILLS